MTKITLTEDMKLKALEQYHPYIIITIKSLDTEAGTKYNNNVNLKILQEDLEDMLIDKHKRLLQSFAIYPGDNERGFSNIIFTPADDEKTIIPFEFYRNIFYIRLPYLCSAIKMHIVSKNYDCMDKLLLLKNEDIINYINEYKPIEKSGASQVLENLDLNSDNRWFVAIPLNDRIKNLSTVEIDAYHKYTNLNKISNDKLGMIDTRTRGLEDPLDEDIYRTTLVLNSENTNNQTHEIQRATPTVSDNQVSEISYNSTADTMQTEKQNDTAKYETIVKYINDKIYIEEYNAKENGEINREARLTTNNHYNYKIGKWTRGV